MKLTKNAIRFMVAIGILIIIFNIVVFTIPFAKTGTFWIAYAFGMIALMIQLAVMKIAFGGANTARSRFYGMPIARIGIIYSVVQVILSLIAMSVSMFIPTWIATAVFIIIFGVTAIGFISADATRDEIERQDQQMVKDVSYMRNLQSKMNLLISQCSDDETGKEVKQLAEEIKYSDPVSSAALSDIERELYHSVEELQQAVVDGDESAAAVCRQTRNILMERNRLCKLNKNV